MPLKKKTPIAIDVQTYDIIYQVKKEPLKQCEWRTKKNPQRFNEYFLEYSSQSYTNIISSVFILGLYICCKMLKLPYVSVDRIKYLQN